jgi:hypothetical protein
VLGQDRDHDGGVLRTLTLVDHRGVGGHQRVEFAKAVGERASVEAGSTKGSYRRFVSDVARTTGDSVILLLALTLDRALQCRERKPQYRRGVGRNTALG